MIITLREYLGEKAAAASLMAAQQTKPTPHQGDTLAAFMKLDPKTAKLTLQTHR